MNHTEGETPGGHCPQAPARSARMVPQGCDLHRQATLDHRRRLITDVQFRAILFREPLAPSLGMSVRGEGMEVGGE